MTRLARKLLWLSLSVLLLAAGSASAQTWTPFGPSNVRYDLELFKAPDISDYPNWPHPNEGMFFQYERLYWSILQPRTYDIGVQGSPFNSADTGFLGARETWGNRYDLGFMEDNQGWFVSILDVQPQIQEYYSNGAPFTTTQTVTGPVANFPPPFGLDRATVTFLDVNLNPFPVSFVELIARNYTSFDGVEVNRAYRYPPNHNGGLFEMFFGVRWLVMTDTFNVDAPDEPGVPAYGGSFWDTEVHNNIFGPQIGLRYDHKRGRWSLYGETRFVPGVNFETVHQRTLLDLTPRNSPPFPTPVIASASPLNPIYPGSPFTASQATETWSNDTVFACFGELRTGVNFQLTNAISVQAGYNFILGTGISRASRRVEYTAVNDFPNPLGGFAIFNGNKHEGFFTNGLSLGITINR